MTYANLQPVLEHSVPLLHARTCNHYRPLAYYCPHRLSHSQPYKDQRSVGNEKTEATDKACAKALLDRISREIAEHIDKGEEIPFHKMGTYRWLKEVAGQ